MPLIRPEVEGLRDFEFGACALGLAEPRSRAVPAPTMRAPVMAAAMLFALSHFRMPIVEVVNFAVMALVIANVNPAGAGWTAFAERTTLSPLLPTVMPR